MKKRNIILCLLPILIFITCVITNSVDILINKSAEAMPPGIQRAKSNSSKTMLKDPYLRFVVMSDSRGSDHGINNTVVRRTLNQIRKISPSPQFAIIPGDLVSGSDSYEEIREQLSYFKDIITDYYPSEFFYPGFGNHEGRAGIEGEKAFSEVFSELNVNSLEGYNNTVYYFDKLGTRFYMLNSNHPGGENTISDSQLNWIKSNNLKGQKNNIFFFHEPAYPTGAHIGSSLDVNKLQRDKLWEVIDQSPNPIVFCGHEHNYTRRHIDSSFNEIVNGRAFYFNKLVYQVTTGTFGAPIYRDYKDNKNVDVPPVPMYNFVIVDITNDEMRITAYDINGEIIDEF